VPVPASAHLKNVFIILDLDWNISSFWFECLETKRKSDIEKRASNSAWLQILDTAKATAAASQLE